MKYDKTVFSGKWVLSLVILLLVHFSYAQKKGVHSPVHKAPHHKTEKHPVRYGTGSFYAKKFNGRRTANGEFYDGTKFTAACNVLPLNTWIRVTNLRNKRQVVVKVNDRLNSRNKRLVDLSYAAARKLGYTSQGLTRVKVEVVPRPRQQRLHPKTVHGTKAR